MISDVYPPETSLPGDEPEDRMTHQPLSVLVFHGPQLRHKDSGVPAVGDVVWSPAQRERSV